MTDIGTKFLNAVREGRVPGISVDPENPATQYDAMPIDSPPGTKVRFTGYGGGDWEQELARKRLTVGGIYSVEKTDIGGWHTDVHLVEFPGVTFNSVMFEAT